MTRVWEQDEHGVGGWRDAPGGSMPLLTVTKHLAASDILNMAGESGIGGYTVIEAPGAGNIIVADYAVVRLNFVSAEYHWAPPDDNTGNMALDLGVSTDALFGAVFGSSLRSTESKMEFADVGASNSNVIVDPSEMIDVPLLLTLQGQDNPVSGDSTVDLTVFYRIFPISTFT
jgi:hypothetical protein